MERRKCLADKRLDGRPRYVNILDCYLKKNLVTRGGYLDEIHFMLNTQEQMDREWLDELIKTEPLYKKFDTGESGGHYNSIWDHAKDPDTMYIKIDDDVVRSCTRKGRGLC